MRKFLLAATILAPFAMAPAFAEMPHAMTAAGDVNVAKTTAGSSASVGSEQNTMAGGKAGGNGAVIVGAVSGNYSAVETGAGATAGPKGSFTNTSAQQVNIGGTAAGGLGDNANHSNGATGKASGAQNSQANGGSSANAANTNVGASVKVQQPRGGHR